MATQYFSDDYLEHCKSLSSEQIVQFLEEFRLINQPVGASKLISIKIPEHLLSTFRQRCDMLGVRYQSQIKTLMREWLLN